MVWRLVHGLGLVDWLVLLVTGRIVLVVVEVLAVPVVSVAPLDLKVLPLYVCTREQHAHVTHCSTFALKV